MKWRRTWMQDDDDRDTGKREVRLLLLLGSKESGKGWYTSAPADARAKLDMTRCRA
jgi:hypothetical protein